MIMIFRMKLEELDAATCTDLPQMWGQKGESAKNQSLFEPVPVSEFCHIPKRKRHCEWEHSGELTSDILDVVKSIIYEGTVRCNMYIQQSFPALRSTLTDQLFRRCAVYMHVEKG